ETSIVYINPECIRCAADYVSQKIAAEQYTRHIYPPESYPPPDPLTRQCLDGIFIISAPAFSFWPKRDSTPEWYGVERWKGSGTEDRFVHTGCWRLVTAVNGALGGNILVTNPAFYSSESLCPD
ncbi:hypothetical protein F5141DRAFT_994001, partial [Pisolithus sp. B1]